MSRIGNAPIPIADEVSVSIEDKTVMVKGPKGELSHTLPPLVSATIMNGKIVVKRTNSTKEAKSLHGLTRALLANMVSGVTKGYEKTLELVGTGYRAKKQGDVLHISVGFSSPVEYQEPEGITLQVEGNNIIKVQGIDKQQVGQTAAEIRKIRPPEPYKGKGIKYLDEYVRRKAGKAAKVGEAA